MRAVLGQNPRLKQRIELTVFVKELSFAVSIDSNVGVEPVDVPWSPFIA